MDPDLNRRQEYPVKHIIIDRQPDAVKHFFATLALTPEGSIVEMNGRAIVHIVPANAVPEEPDETEWTPQLNHRRCDLMDKKFAGGLTMAEETELARLTAGLRRFVDRVAPVPVDEVRQLHQQLLEKSASADAHA